MASREWRIEGEWGVANGKWIFYSLLPIRYSPSTV